MAKDYEKIDFHLWIHPETLELIKKHRKEQGYKTHSMYVEKAVEFYSAYLSSQDKWDYLPEVFSGMFKGYFSSFEDKLCNMIFKIAVELGMFLHVYCALNDVTEDNLEEVHDAVMKEVRSTYGGFSIDNISKFQNSLK